MIVFNLKKQQYLYITCIPVINLFTHENQSLLATENMIFNVKRFISPTFDIYLCGAMDVASIYHSAGSEFEYHKDFYFHE